MRKTRTDVIQELERAREEGRPPSIRGWNLLGQDLSGLDLRYADLQYVNLRGTNLRGVNPRCATLRGTGRLILHHIDLPSGDAIFFPTPDGWHLSIGCWDGTLDDLRAMIATDEDWPGAEGEGCARRRPGLELLIQMCELHIADHEGVVEALDKKWNKKKKKNND